MSKSHLEEKLESAILNDGSLPEYIRNYRHAFPGRKLEIDFWFDDYRVGVEVQGGIFIPPGKKSGHIGIGQHRDYEKMNLAQINDILLLQCDTKMLGSQDRISEFIEMLKAALRKRGWRG